MKITEVHAFQYDAGYTHGDFAMSRGRTARSHRSLVVRVVTDDGLDGWGETCPNGPAYLPSFFEGERAALGVLAEAVLGLDPRNLGRLNQVMDAALVAGTAAKSALDCAAWDIFGQSVGRPVAELLGGRLHDSVPLFVAVAVAADDAIAAFVGRELDLGIRVFQVKVGGEPRADATRVRAVVEAAGPDSIVIADANGGWPLGAALHAAKLLEDLPIRLEQPCRSMTDCAELRRHTRLPLILDEAVNGIEDLMIAKLVAGASGVNIKPGRLGGLTKARLVRDAAQGLGMTFTVDDTWGGALVTAQNSALAASSSAEYLTGVTYFSEWIEPVIAAGPRMLADGRGATSAVPGLGVEVDVSRLGPAILSR